MLLKTGAIDEAEKAFRDALAAFPGYHPALAGMGRVLAARERYEEAVEAFQNVLTWFTFVTSIRPCKKSTSGRFGAAPL
jgi:tetratricopeptide (TPR) repeat protein